MATIDRFHAARPVRSTGSPTTTGVTPARRLRSMVVACGTGIVLLAGIAPTSAAQLRWMAAESDLDRALASYLADSNIISDLLALTGRNIALVPELQLSIGPAADGSRAPAYVARERRIRLPYAYFEDAIRAQAGLAAQGNPVDPARSAVPDSPAAAAPGAGPKGPEGQAVRYALDLLEYTLYHLLAHALLGDDDVAVDAQAEAVSAWLMIKGWPNGAAQWVEASRAFGRASQRLDGPLEHYWHGHALSASSERRDACWALGAAPATIEPMLDPVDDAAARRERCRQNWLELDREMRVLLHAVLVPDAPLGAPPGVPPGVSLRVPLGSRLGSGHDSLR